MSILDDFYTPKVMSDTYQFTENPRYLSLPEQSLKMYIASIKEFPLNDSPDIFGLHANAEVSYQQGEAFTMFSNLMLVQTSSAGGSGGQSLYRRCVWGELCAEGGAGPEERREDPGRP